MKNHPIKEIKDESSGLKNLPPLEAIDKLFNGVCDQGEEEPLLEAIQKGFNTKMSRSELIYFLNDALQCEEEPETVLTLLEHR